MILGGFERITLGAGLAFRRREDLQAELSLRTAKHEDTSRRYLQSGTASEPPAQIPNPKPKPQTPNPKPQTQINQKVPKTQKACGTAATDLVGVEGSSFCLECVPVTGKPPGAKYPLNI